MGLKQPLTIEDKKALLSKAQELVKNGMPKMAAIKAVGIKKTRFYRWRAGRFDGTNPTKKVAQKPKPKPQLLSMPVQIEKFDDDDKRILELSIELQRIAFKKWLNHVR